MTGLIKQGLSAGGKAYGYRPDPANRGKPVVVPEEAAIVVRIFEDYTKGISPKAICKRLNAEHVKPPRGKLWSPSAVIGFAARGSGMLRNSIYVGRIVWNKVRMVKDPSNGKRLSRPNPESEWQTANVPELRIMPDDLFEAVQAQLAGPGTRQQIGEHRYPQAPQAAAVRASQMRCLRFRHGRGWRGQVGQDATSVFRPHQQRGVPEPQNLLSGGRGSTSHRQPDKGSWQRPNRSTPMRNATSRPVSNRSRTRTGAASRSRPA
jgi:hypothetical protein